MNLSRHTRYAVCCAVVALAALLACLAALGSNGLFDLDEGLYAEASREALITGDYITPHVNGQPFFEKPPLIYWMASATMRMFGQSAFAVRLPSALATAALMLTVAYVGTRLFGRRAGLLAAAAFVTAPLVLGEARQLTTDATLDLCNAAALFAVLAVARGANSRTCSLLFAGACAAGVLTKGAPGLIFPLLVPAATCWLLRKRPGAWGPLRKVVTGRSIALFAVLAVPWHVAAWKQSGEAFVREYIIRQHFERFRGGDTAHRAPVWFYIPGLAAGFFPWSIFLPRAVARVVHGYKQYAPAGRGGWNHQPAEQWSGAVWNRAEVRLFLLVWAALVFLLFSLSGSKLISYILPMYPPCALLVGESLSRITMRRRAQRGLVVTGACGVIVALAAVAACANYRRIAIIGGRITHKPVDLAAIGTQVPQFVLLITSMVLTGCLVFLVLASLQQAKSAIYALVLSASVLVAASVFVGLPAVDAAYLAPLQNLAVTAGARADAFGGSVVIAVGPPRRPSLLFYLPSRLFRPAAGQPRRVWEATSIAELASAPRPLWILTRAAVWRNLWPLKGAHPVATAGPWTLSRAP